MLARVPCSGYLAPVLSPRHLWQNSFPFRLFCPPTQLNPQWTADYIFSRYDSAHGLSSYLVQIELQNMSANLKNCEKKNLNDNLHKKCPKKKSKNWTAAQTSNLPKRFSEQQCTRCSSGTAIAKKCPYRKLGRICLKQKFAQKIHSNNKSCLKCQLAILQMLKGINCQSQLVDSRFSLKLGAYLVQTPSPKVLDIEDLQKENTPL